MDAKKNKVRLSIHKLENVGGLQYCFNYCSDFGCIFSYSRKDIVNATETLNKFLTEYPHKVIELESPKAAEFQGEFSKVCEKKGIKQVIKPNKVDRILSR